jgi:GTPase SAR1 family protein
MNNYAINLYIWDGPGDKMEEYLREEQFNAMDGLLYVFDLTDRQSLHQIENLHHLIKQ